MALSEGTEQQLSTLENQVDLVQKTAMQLIESAGHEVQVLEKEVRTHFGFADEGDILVKLKGSNVKGPPPRLTLHGDTLTHIDAGYGDIKVRDVLEGNFWGK